MMENRCSRDALFLVDQRKGARERPQWLRPLTATFIESFASRRTTPFGGPGQHLTHILLTRCRGRSPPCAFARLDRAATWVARIKTDVPSIHDYTQHAGDGSPLDPPYPCHTRPALQAGAGEPKPHEGRMVDQRQHLS